jgi:hypothetical protein
MFLILKCSRIRYKILLLGSFDEPILTQGMKQACMEPWIHWWIWRQCYLQTTEPGLGALYPVIRGRFSVCIDVHTVLHGNPCEFL